ncbi:MAG: FG-GAP repeat protein, partial [Acidimicrobiales bacterium]|nr:FG-GAP repeat protein [Acidimicrobiales bacterium]
MGDKVFYYSHLQASAVRTAGITSKGVTVQQGQVLGRLLPAAGSFTGSCGHGVGSHLHLTMPYVPITIDGVRFSTSGPNGVTPLRSTNSKSGESPSPAALRLSERGIAHGDFDGDGVDDLAIGVPGENVGSVVDAGVVNLIYGSRSGLN